MPLLLINFHGQGQFSPSPPKESHWEVGRRTLEHWCHSLLSYILIALLLRGFLVRSHALVGEICLLLLLLSPTKVDSVDLFCRSLSPLSFRVTFDCCSGICSMLCKLGEETRVHTRRYYETEHISGKFAQSNRSLIHFANLQCRSARAHRFAASIYLCKAFNRLLLIDRELIRCWLANKIKQFNWLSG